MGKKGRKTRWRTLNITDEHSDSEESNTTTSGHRVPKGLSQKSYYSRFTYSSQSTPTRRYQCDGTKSTRSSSTASENKITFNEDEYTRITTPRQDVLFKKGYLNKPKTYQTQTSTGNSTTSTGNGTPDHQSTDLEYESQFVFPNGFVDQNGIYYVNSFEPYPLMVFNPPTYFSEFSNVKSKRCSTSSLAESTSPNNEETSQDLSQSETPSNISEFNHVYNVIYPGFYFNSACPPQEVVTEHEPRRMKKKKRRRPSPSKSIQDATTSEYTDDSSDEVFSDDHEKEKLTDEAKLSKDTINSSEAEETKEEDAQQRLLNGLMPENREDSIEPQTALKEIDKNSEDINEADQENGVKEQIEENHHEVNVDDGSQTKYDLKPDAEEFVPWAYRQHETIPMDPNIHFIKIPSNFVPLPILNPISEFNGQGFNAFIPPGIPINFIPQNYINFIPNVSNRTSNVHLESKTNEEVTDQDKEKVEVPKNQIDIAKIVSKLEEAAKEQDEETVEKEDNKNKPNVEITNASNRRSNVSGRPYKRNRSQKTKSQSEDRKSTEPNEAKKIAWKSPSSPRKEPAQLSPKPVARNYSETLKKSQTSPTVVSERYERNMEQQKLNRTAQREVREAKNTIKTEHLLPKSPNGWVSVTSRKKRKNKNVEEVEEFEENCIAQDDKEDRLESYVVNELTDFVLPTTTELEVTTTESESILVIATSKSVELESVAVSSVETFNELSQEIKEEQKEKSKNITKKKYKKHPKATIKRIIITDVDLSLETEKSVAEDKVEEVIETEVALQSVVTEERNNVVPETIQDEILEEKEEDKKLLSEKKPKKKKKKLTKPILLSQSSSNTTINVVDDSYDFLLENSLLDETIDKTNVEVSQELDKMIQRGMYSSLEEKMKSLNIESNDNFFKTIINNISSRESSVEKNSFIKTPDFSKILSGTSKLLKPQPVTVEPVASKLLTFLDKSSADSIVEKENELKQKLSDENHKENLYPITKAVKEWMTKTREATPDVEILKSPSTILREFGLDEQNNGNSLSVECRDTDTGADDETTIYSFTEEDSVNIRDELASGETKSKRTSTSSVEEGEDVLEIYDSTYGKNEDYLKIQKEIEERKASGNVPKHGNLPYRAICCSIM